VFDERPNAAGELEAVTNDDHAQCLCRFSSGVMGHLYFSRVSSGRKMGYAYEVVGSKGAIRFDQEDQNALWLYKMEGPEAERGFRKILTGPAHPDYVNFCLGPGHGTGYQDQLIIEARDFLAAIDAGKPQYIDMLDEVSDVLLQILEEESTENNAGADHFAAAGTNSRIWNAHEKLCMRNPQLFARYNANDAFALVCGAWLGPGYQITAQVNVVHPGGRAQVCHRDYHLGFQGREVLVEYPSHVHSLSPLLTLQGGIAHSQVPLASGSTQLLPFSQQLLRGYMDVHDQRFIDYFNKHRVQVPLDKGDMLFFNPALFHAAGDNDTTDFHRFVNLFQVGSAYGRTLEIVDRARMSIHVYPVIQSMLEAGSLSQRDVGNVVAACAEGYPFPANLDLEPPVGGLAVPSQQAVMLKALKEGMQASEFTRLIHEQMSLKRSC